MFNPNAQIHALPIYPGQWCCVIDDVLLEPEAMRQAGFRTLFGS